MNCRRRMRSDLGRDDLPDAQFLIIGQLYWRQLDRRGVLVAYPEHQDASDGVSRRGHITCKILLSAVRATVQLLLEVRS